MLGGGNEGFDGTSWILQVTSGISGTINSIATDANKNIWVAYGVSGNTVGTCFRINQYGAIDLFFETTGPVAVAANSDRTKIAISCEAVLTIYDPAGNATQYQARVPNFADAVDLVFDNNDNLYILNETVTSGIGETLDVHKRPSSNYNTVEWGKEFEAEPLSPSGILNTLDKQGPLTVFMNDCANAFQITTSGNVANAVNTNAYRQTYPLQGGYVNFDGTGFYAENTNATNTGSSGSAVGFRGLSVKDVSTYCATGSGGRVRTLSGGAWAISGPGNTDFRVIDFDVDDNVIAASSDTIIKIPSGVSVSGTYGSYTISGSSLSPAGNTTSAPTTYSLSTPTSSTSATGSSSFTTPIAHTANRTEID
jgi:hypothetical protein